MSALWRFLFGGSNDSPPAVSGSVSGSSRGEASRFKDALSQIREGLNPSVFVSAESPPPLSSDSLQARKRRYQGRDADAVVLPAVVPSPHPTVLTPLVSDPAPHSCSVISHIFTFLPFRCSLLTICWKLYAMYLSGVIPIHLVRVSVRQLKSIESSRFAVSTLIFSRVLAALEPAVAHRLLRLCEFSRCSLEHLSLQVVRSGLVRDEVQAEARGFSDERMFGEIGELRKLKIIQTGTSLGHLDRLKSLKVFGTPAFVDQLEEDVEIEREGTGGRDNKTFPDGIESLSIESWKITEEEEEGREELIRRTFRGVVSRWKGLRSLAYDMEPDVVIPDAVLAKLGKTLSKLTIRQAWDKSSNLEKVAGLLLHQITFLGAVRECPLQHIRIAFHPVQVYIHVKRFLESLCHFHHLRCLDFSIIGQHGAIEHVFLPNLNDASPSRSLEQALPHFEDLRLSFGRRVTIEVLRKFRPLIRLPTLRSICLSTIEKDDKAIVRLLRRSLGPQIDSVDLLFAQTFQLEFDDMVPLLTRLVKRLMNRVRVLRMRVADPTYPLVSKFKAYAAQFRELLRMAILSPTIQEFEFAPCPAFERKVRKKMWKCLISTLRLRDGENDGEEEEEEGEREEEEEGEAEG